MYKNKLDLSEFLEILYWKNKTVLITGGLKLYSKKINDSKSRGFEYQVKVFEINYELFNSLKDNMVLEQE